jgi:hypothetical protein
MKKTINLLINKVVNLEIKKKQLEIELKITKEKVDGLIKVNERLKDKLNL